MCVYVYVYVYVYNIYIYIILTNMLASLRLLEYTKFVIIS